MRPGGRDQVGQDPGGEGHPDYPHFIPERFLPAINARVDKFLVESV